MKFIREKGQEFEYEVMKTSACEEYHCHNGIEIIYVKSGVIRLRTDMSQMVCDISDGDYAVIANSDVHRCFCMGMCEYELIRFPVSYQNMLDGNIIRNSFIIPGDVLKENAVVSDTLSHIRKFLLHEDCVKPAVRSMCAGLCSILLSYFGKRKNKDNSGDEKAEFMIPQNISFETVKKFDITLNYIKENYTNKKINLEILSNISGLNKTFLSALFPKLTGNNFKDYLNHLRVDRAVELLTSSEKNISEIAFLCGFETIRTLNNVFKSIAGVTPSELRSGASGKNKSGIDTAIAAAGDKIFEYSWICNVNYKFEKDINAVYLYSEDRNEKCWCHLLLRMFFFAGKEYSISFKAKVLDETDNNYTVCCNFCFPDDVKNIEHHTPSLIKITDLEDGWQEYNYSYKIPDYYKAASLDNFSVYTSPYKEKSVSFLLKDVIVEVL